MWKTPSTPTIGAFSVSRSVMSPACISTPSALSMVARPGARTRATTLWPRPINCLTSSPPMNPVAPVTKYFAIPRVTECHKSNADHGLLCTFKLRKAINQILDQVVGVLDTRRQANEIVRESERGALIGRNRRVRHAGGVADQRFHTTQAFGQGKESARRHELGEFVLSAVQLD